MNRFKYIFREATPYHLRFLIGGAEHCPNRLLVRPQTGNRSHPSPPIFRRVRTPSESRPKNAGPAPAMCGSQPPTSPNSRPELPPNREFSGSQKILNITCSMQVIVASL